MSTRAQQHDASGLCCQVHSCSRTIPLIHLYATYVDPSANMMIGTFVHRKFDKWSADTSTKSTESSRIDEAGDMLNAAIRSQYETHSSNRVEHDAIPARWLCEQEHIASRL